MGLSNKLAYARQKSGLKGPQVQEKTGIGKSTLSEFENGKREPSLNQLNLLAKLYRRSIAFFLDESEIPTEIVLWREQPGQNSEDIERHFLRLCEQYHNLEIWTEEVLELNLPEYKGDTNSFGYPQAEKLAKDVRDMLKLGDRPGLCLLTVLEEICGIKIFHLPFEPSGTAASARNTSFGAAILLNLNNVRWRRNFDLAHELFHLLTWNIFRKENSTNFSSSTNSEEKLATCFARNLLMPQESIRSALSDKIKGNKLSIEVLFDVARQFDVSVEALIWHLSFIRFIPYDEGKIRELIEKCKNMAPIFEEREDTRSEIRPERFKAIAIKALRHGEIAIGRFAEYLDISRQEAMKFLEQGDMEDEEISITAA